MTSGGVHDWITNASKGRSDCALKILSASFGKRRENCGACPFCRLIPTTNVKVDAERRIEQERKNEQATERVLMKLALLCLACKQVECRGIPILDGKGSKKKQKSNLPCCRGNQ